jgi:hypothetical protein
MKPRLRVLIFAAALVVVLVALSWWITSRPNAALSPLESPTLAAANGQSSRFTNSLSTPEPPSAAVAPNEPRQSQEQAVLAALSKPISFWGKVVDQQDKPVGGATVEWSANNNANPYGSGTKGWTESDANGMFAITSYGIGLYAKVSKDGYSQIPTELRKPRGSSGGFSNAAKLGNTDSPMGTRSNPAVFVLHKKREAAELTHVPERPVKVPKNGAPVEISLTTREAVPAGEAGLRLACWTEDQNKDAQGHYPWLCRISVPSGGLVKREGDYDFEAPVEGYQPSDDIGPPADRWSANAERQFFVKMADNRFARVNLRMRTGGEHFVVIESYLNPQPGSRNLEYDPAKQPATR